MTTVTTVPTGGSAWRTSSYTSSGNDCVEVRGDLWCLQDTKHRGPQLPVDVKRLVAAVKAGQFER